MGASATIPSDVKLEMNVAITIEEAHQIIVEFDINVISDEFAKRYYDSEQTDDLKLDTEMKEMNLDRVVECFEILLQNDQHSCMGDILDRFRKRGRTQNR